jgi:hypothetical protein
MRALAELLALIPDADIYAGFERAEPGEQAVVVLD